MTLSKTNADILERVFWTAVQAGTAVVTVETFEVDKFWIPIIAIALATLKSIASTKVGTKGSASSLPASYDS